MEYSPEDLKREGFLNAVARRWSRGMAKRLRDHKERTGWIGAGGSAMAMRMQSKMSELMSLAGKSADSAEAVMEAAADLANLAHMFAETRVAEMEAERVDREKEASESK